MPLVYCMCNWNILENVFVSIRLILFSDVPPSLLSLETVTLFLKSYLWRKLWSQTECHQPFIFTAPHWSYDWSYRVSMFSSITSLPSVITPLNLFMLPDRIYTLSALMRSKYLQRCRSGTRMTPTTSICPIREASTSPWQWKTLKPPGALEGTRCWTCMR